MGARDGIKSSGDLYVSEDWKVHIDSLKNHQPCRLQVRQSGKEKGQEYWQSSGHFFPNISLALKFIFEESLTQEVIKGNITDIEEYKTFFTERYEWLQGALNDLRK